MKIISLTSGQNRDRNLCAFCCCQNKDNIRRRFFQCLQKSIERSCRKHMHLIDNIYFVLAFCRAIRNLFPDLTDIIHTVIGCSIDLDHVHRSACLNGFAHLTLTQGLPFTGCSQFTAFARIFATVVLPVPRCSAEKICMSDTVCVDLIGQRGHNVILPFDIFKIIRPELSV